MIKLRKLYKLCELSHVHGTRMFLLIWVEIVKCKCTVILKLSKEVVSAESWSQPLNVAVGIAIGEHIILSLMRSQTQVSLGGLGFDADK